MAQRTLDEWDERIRESEEQDREGVRPRIIEDVEPWAEWQSPESDASAYERAPRDLSWGEAYRIQTGEEEKPTRVTPTGYLKEKLMYVPGLVARAGRALESGPTFIDEAGNVVRSGGRPVQTVEESAGVASEIAGFGVGLAQGPGLVKAMVSRFRDRYGRTPTPKEVNIMTKGFEEWAASQPKPDITPEVQTGLRGWRQAEQESMTESILDKLRRDKEAARRPAPPLEPGPRSNLPRRPMLAPGTEADVARATQEEIMRERGRLRAQEPPGRVIEAPPIPEEQAINLRERLARGEDVNIRELLHQQTPRIMMDPAMRDLETGQIKIGPRERPLTSGPPTTREVTGVRTGPIQFPKDVAIGPSRAERMGQLGWSKEIPDGPDDPTFVLRDKSGVTRAEIVEVEAPDAGTAGKAPPTVWRVDTPDGELGIFTNLDEAAAATRAQMPDVPVTPRFYPPIAGGSDMPNFKPRRATPPAEGPAVPGSVPGRYIPDPIPPKDQRPLIPPPDSPPPRGEYITPAPDPVEPYAILRNVDDRQKASRAGKKFDEIVTGLNNDVGEMKSVIGLSTPTDIAKHYPAYGDLVWETKQARRRIEANQNELLHEKRVLINQTSPTEYIRLMRLADENKSLDTTPEIAKLITDHYGKIQDYAGDLPTNTTLKNGFEQRLKQTEVLRGVKAEAVPEYTSEDINRIAPRAAAGEKLKAKLTGDEPYTIENIDRVIRASARADVIGHKLKPGYMTQIKPYLAKLANESDFIKREVDDYVNYFIGAPGSRSPQTMQRWADRLRASQFASKIAGNLTSPVWNAGQNFLTFAEADVKSVSKAWGDVLKYYKNNITGQTQDPNFVALLDRLGVRHEFEATSTMSDIGLDVREIPDGLLAKLDKGLGKFNDVMGLPFRLVEANNRTVAALAGYYDGTARKLDDAKSILRGQKLMDKTQFTGGEADLPSRFRKAPGGVAGQFKTFTIKYMEYMKDNALDAVKAATPGTKMDWQDRKDAIRKFSKFWGSQTALGGVGAVPFIGDYLKEKLEGAPLDVHKGLGGMIGLDLTRQFGVGVLPIKRFEDFLYNLPGPTFNAAQDMLSVMTGKSAGDGFDMSSRGRPLSWDEWERKLVRMAPAGVQAARWIEGLKVALSGGEKGGIDLGLAGRLGAKGIPRKAVTWEQAFGAEKPSGAKMSEVQRNSILTAIGLRGADIERESEIRREDTERVTIENQAKHNAAELYAAGKPKHALDVLRRAEEKLDLAKGSLRPSKQSMSNARRTQQESPIEKLRRQRAKQGIRIPMSED